MHLGDVSKKLPLRHYAILVKLSLPASSPHTQNVAVAGKTDLELTTLTPSGSLLGTEQESALGEPPAASHTREGPDHTLLLGPRSPVLPIEAHLLPSLGHGLACAGALS